MRLKEQHTQVLNFQGLSWIKQLTIKLIYITYITFCHF